MKLYISKEVIKIIKTVSRVLIVILISILIPSWSFASPIEPFGPVTCPVFGEHHHGIGGSSYVVKLGHYEYLDGNKTLIVDGRWPGDPNVRSYTCECGARIFCEGSVEIGNAPFRYFTKAERVGGYDGGYEVVILESSIEYSEEPNSIVGWVFYDHLFSLEHR